jgi:hypothetical protein
MMKYIEFTAGGGIATFVPKVQIKWTTGWAIHLFITMPTNKFNRMLEKTLH